MWKRYNNTTAVRYLPSSSIKDDLDIGHCLLSILGAANLFAILQLPRSQENTCYELRSLINLYGQLLEAQDGVIKDIPRFSEKERSDSVA